MRFKGEENMMNENLKQEAVLEDYLFKNEALNKSMVVSKEKHNAKLARLNYKVLESIRTYSKPPFPFP